MSRYRVSACSVTRPGTFLVQDEEGNCSVYFKRTGSLSATTLDPALTDAIIQCDGWCRIETEMWLSLDELKNHVVETIAIRPQNLMQTEL